MHVSAQPKHKQDSQFILSDELEGFAEMCLSLIQLLLKAKPYFSSCTGWFRVSS